MVLAGLFCGIFVMVSAGSAIAEPKGARDVKAPADKPAPKLVGEKEIMTLDDTIGVGHNRGLWMMRLSPDRRRVLYLRKKICKSIIRPDGKPSDRTGYKLILRDLKTGKDATIPVPAFFSDANAVVYLSMMPFDPTGKTLVVPVCQDTNKNDFMDYETEKSKVGLYDIASGKLTILEIEADVTFPLFSSDGKNLVVMTMTMKSSLPVKVFVTPTDKIKFRKLSHSGRPYRICPTSSLMPMVLVVKKKTGKCVLYDLKADVSKFDLTDKAPILGWLYNEPQWASDGRYLYLSTLKRVHRQGKTLAVNPCNPKIYVIPIWFLDFGCRQRPR